MPIAAARFAGGRGIALDVHTDSNANPLRGFILLLSTYLVATYLHTQRP